MKVYSLIALLIVSNFAYSQDSSDKFKHNQDYIYLGGTYNDFNDLTLESIPFDLTSGFSLSVGRSWALGSKWNLNLEMEYLDLGEYEVVSPLGYISISASSLAVNFKPVFRPSGSGFFIGGQAGLGKYTFDLGYVDTMMGAAGKGSQTEYGIAVGAEIGYEFDRLILAAGYRAMSSMLEGSSVDMSTISIGGRYKF